MKFVELVDKKTFSLEFPILIKQTGRRYSPCENQCKPLYEFSILEHTHDYDYMLLIFNQALT